MGAQVLRLGFGIAAVIACAMAVSLIGISATPRAAGPQAEPPDPGRARTRRLAGGVAVTALGYLLYVACESGTSGWIPAHLESFRYSVPFATGVTSGFWGAMAVGRILAGPASRTVAAHRMVLAAAPLLAVVLALAAIRDIAPVCYVAAGFAAAPIFPIGLDWIAADFPRDRPATSWALIGSFAGGIVGPAAVAAVVWLIGIHAVPVVLACLAAATSLAFLALRRQLPAAGSAASEYSAVADDH
jgi:MFS transporter, FHS family, glucose/mannose:H+ symporter